MHLRDIVSGAKTSLQSYQIKTICVPHYEGLTIKDILAYAGKHDVVMQALPVPKECLRLERSYISNLIYSIVGQPYKDWVDVRVNERNRKVAVVGNQLINMDPEIARVFRQSTQVSTTNGTSCHLMKSSAKRRRTKAEILADRAARRDGVKGQQEAVEMLEQMAANWEQEKKRHAEEMAQMRNEV